MTSAHRKAPMPAKRAPKRPLRLLTDSEIIAGETVPSAFKLSDRDPEFDFFPGKLTSYEVEVTPKLAEKFLQRNVNNRDILPAHVDSLISAMSSKEWKRGAARIVFDTTGRLIDGQHTSEAIRRSGLTVPVMMITGVDPEAQHVMDSGRRRSAASAMVIAGEVDRAIASKVEAVCRTAIAREEGQHRLVRNNVNGLRTPRNPEIMAYLHANPDVLDAVKRAGELRTTKPTLRLQFVSPAALAYAYLVLARIDHRQAEQFFQDLSNRKSTGKGDPIAAVFECYEAWTASKANGAMRMAGHLYILFTAWNARREGRKIDRIDPKPVRRAGKDVPKEVPTPR